MASEPIRDINLRELVAVVPICVLCLWIGVMPQPLLDLIRPDVDAVVAVYANISRRERVAVSPRRVAGSRRVDVAECQRRHPRGSACTPCLDHQLRILSCNRA